MGQRRVTETDGRDAGCLVRFNQLRLQQLQQTMNMLMEMRGRLIF